jgi:hypothetical protein
MNVREFIFEISLSALSEVNVYAYEYWVGQLCDSNENLIKEKLTDENLYLLQKDVEIMSQTA